MEARQRREAIARWALHPNQTPDPNSNPNPNPNPDPNPNPNLNPSLDPNPNQVGGAQGRLVGAAAAGADCAAGVT
eukprot:scaffold67994_cov45-Phaeocystis_antarctica.AAC.1